MKIAIGCDHIVTAYKNEVAQALKDLGHDVVDMGTYDNERTHYPIFGQKVGIAVAQKQVELGVVICGTGVGITNSAQKVKGTRTILTRDVNTAVEARKQFNANVVGLGGRITGVGLGIEIVNAFINEKYVETKESKETILKIDSLIKDENYDTTIFDEEIKKWDEGYYHD